MNKIITIILFLNFIIAPLTSYANSICNQLITEIDKNLETKTFTEQTKNKIVELRVAGLSAAKDPALSESLGISCEEVLNEALALSKTTE
tara:strand:+ start:327 stop:596 length:270 start_codon:yes stop_codon:yes gene_type:complete